MLRKERGCSNRHFNEAAGEVRAGRVPSGYVEDSDKPRTKLKAGFSSRLR